MFVISRLFKRGKYSQLNPITLLLACIFGMLLALGINSGVSAFSAGQIDHFCVDRKSSAVSFRVKCKTTETRYSYALSGKSAYEIWQQQGNTGSEQDFINALKGKNGRDGENGSAAISFASNCYQKLKLAMASGLNFRYPREDQRFESISGCTLRDINLNPNSQVATLADFGARILGTKLIAFHAMSGDGSMFGGIVSGLAEYEVQVEKAPGITICSPSENYRFIESPINHKTYAIGSTEQFLNTQTRLILGTGEAISQTVLDGDGTTTLSSDLGKITWWFENFPSAMPLNTDHIIKVVKLTNLSGSRITTDSTHVDIYGGNLAEVTRMPNEAGYLAVFKIHTNSSETGNTQLTFGYDIADGAPNIGSIVLPVGVSFCNGDYGGDRAWFDPYIDPMSAIYSFFETTDISGLESPTISGWNWSGWYPKPSWY